MVQRRLADTFKRLAQHHRRAILGFVEGLAKTLTKPLVIVIDNASIHRARAIQSALRLLEGLRNIS